MSRSFTPKVLTANDLLDGDVIYLDASHAWTRRLSDAHLFTDETAANAALDLANDQPAIAVGAYLADAKTGQDGPAATLFREEFRRRGPSNYAHGKQVELSNV